VPRTGHVALLLLGEAFQHDAALFELSLDPRVVLGDEMREEVL
jgi:hypothetical protein